MAAKKTKGSAQKGTAVEPGSVDELARVIVLQLRYAGAPQGALIHDLSKLDLEPSRIAQLLGATADTVRHQKREKRPAWPPKETPRK